MDTKITVVVDNNTSAGLACEHGLSLWIESGGKRILFDTGQTTALQGNAQELGTDLATTDVLILSHGHYDHTGGIPHVLEQAKAIDVYCHPGVVRPRYAKRQGNARSIGMPQVAVEALQKLPAERLHWVPEPLMLTENIGLTGPIPRLTSYEDTGGPFFLDPEPTRPDLIEDDLALWIRTDQGLVVCMGCSHAGVVNTLDYIRALTDGTRVRAVVGGFHLLNASDERLAQSVLALQSLAPDALIPCHCTGKSAVAALRDTLGDRVTAGASGMSYEF